MSSVNDSEQQPVSYKTGKIAFAYQGEDVLGKVQPYIQFIHSFWGCCERYASVMCPGAPADERVAKFFAFLKTSPSGKVMLDKYLAVLGPVLNPPDPKINQAQHSRVEDKTDEHRSRVAFVQYGQMQHFVVPAIQAKGKGEVFRILDLGCSHASGLQRLLTNKQYVAAAPFQASIEYVGIDRSQESLDGVHKPGRDGRTVLSMAADHNISVRLECGDYSDKKYHSGKFDVVLLNNSGTYLGGALADFLHYLRTEVLAQHGILTGICLDADKLDRDSYTNYDSMKVERRGEDVHVTVGDKTFNEKRVPESTFNPDVMEVYNVITFIKTFCNESAYSRQAFQLPELASYDVFVCRHTQSYISITTEIKTPVSLVESPPMEGLACDGGARPATYATYRFMAKEDYFTGLKTDGTILRTVRAADGLYLVDRAGHCYTVANHVLVDIEGYFEYCETAGGTGYLYCLDIVRFKGATIFGGFKYRQTLARQLSTKYKWISCKPYFCRGTIPEMIAYLDSDHGHRADGFVFQPASFGMFCGNNCVTTYSKFCHSLDFKVDSGVIVDGPHKFRGKRAPLPGDIRDGLVEYEVSGDTLTFHRFRYDKTYASTDAYYSIIQQCPPIQYLLSCCLRRVVELNGSDAVLHNWLRIGFTKGAFSVGTAPLNFAKFYMSVGVAAPPVLTTDLVGEITHVLESSGPLKSRDICIKLKQSRNGRGSQDPVLDKDVNGALYRHFDKVDNDTPPTFGVRVVANGPVMYA